jgi:hypothetical protein
MKRISILAALLFMASLLFSQSVTDLAKKEKERRAAVKGKPASVITNEDLAKLKKKPAVQVAEEARPAEAETAQAEAAAVGQAGAAQAPPAKAEQAAQAQEAAAEQPQQSQQPAQPLLSEQEFKAKLAELSGNLDKAQERFDLLTLKMNALWMEFNNMDDMKSRELLQRQIGETYDKLTQAQLNVARAQSELDDFLAKARREGVPEIWIR